MIDSVTQSPFETVGPSDHMNAAQFGEQASAGVGIFSPGLQETQQTANARVPRSIMPSMSGNGMSSEQYQQTLGGQMPVDNGMAASQYQTARFTMGKE
jgi:hypothetical protein